MYILGSIGLVARSTLRNIIGTLTLKSANSERGKINSELQRTMRDETTHWGIQIVRTELKEIDPPADVQETMNKVVKAENEKVAAIDFATATETIADGARRAEIKKAEGIKQAKILEAEGEAQAIQLVNEAAEKYSVGNAQLTEETHHGRARALERSPRSSSLRTQSSSTSSAIWRQSCPCRGATESRARRGPFDDVAPPRSPSR